jgi:hypothetical protein
MWQEQESAVSSSATLAIPRNFLNEKFYYHVHKSTTLTPVLRQMNPVSIFPSYVFKIHLIVIVLHKGARFSVVVKAIGGFDTRWGDFLNVPNPSGRTRPWGFTQPPTEISTRNIKIIMSLGSKVQPVRRADNLAAICEPIV